MDKVGKAWLLTKLDMDKGYHQVKCDDNSVYSMTDFVTPFGFFHFGYTCIMPFALRNAPATSSRLVCKVVLGSESFCLVCLDAVLVFSET